MSWKLALPIAVVLLAAAPATFAEDNRPAPEPIENCNERHLMCAEWCGKNRSGAALNACLTDCSNSRTYCKDVLTQPASPRNPRDRAPSRLKDRPKDAG